MVEVVFLKSLWHQGGKKRGIPLESGVTPGKPFRTQEMMLLIPSGGGDRAVEVETHLPEGILGDR